MTIAVYVAEIDGRGVAAFNAEHITEAEQLIESPWFKDDLYEFGWNGKSSIFLRNPYPEEREKFELSWAKATRAGDVDEGGYVATVASSGRAYGRRRRRRLSTVIATRAAPAWGGAAFGIQKDE